MSRHLAELYAQFSYGEQLSYEELLEIEDRLIAAVQDVLVRAGGEHLDFTPLGDCLMVQCAFEAHRLYVFRKISMHVAGFLPEHVTGRILCVDKRLDASHLYWVQPGRWEEEDRSIPVLPPEGVLRHDVHRLAADETDNLDDLAEQEDDGDPDLAAPIPAVAESSLADAAGK